MSQVPKYIQDIELKVEIFKIIRANQGKTSKQIIAILKEHLPDVSASEIIGCLEELSQQ